MNIKQFNLTLLIMTSLLWIFVGIPKMIKDMRTHYVFETKCYYVPLYGSDEPLKIYISEPTRVEYYWPWEKK